MAEFRIIKCDGCDIDRAIEADEDAYPAEYERVRARIENVQGTPSPYNSLCYVVDLCAACARIWKARVANPKTWPRHELAAPVEHKGGTNG